MLARSQQAISATLIRTLLSLHSIFLNKKTSTYHFPRIKSSIETTFRYLLFSKLMKSLQTILSVKQKLAEKAGLDLTQDTRSGKQKESYQIGDVDNQFYFLITFW